MYRGNFNVDFSTESHVSASLEQLGHHVIRLQEDEVPWPATIEACEGADLFLWTATYSMAHVWDQRQAHKAIELLNTRLPTAAFHLDKWIDLPRESQITTEPMWRMAHVFTADGGNQDRFESYNVNHHYLPPGVYGPECYIGTPREEFISDIAFVGSWKGHYHPESRHRRALINFLRRRYKNRIAFWPQTSGIRGKDLNDLYASVKVVVGDSCMVGSPKRGHYTSDRVPETTGRGGFLIHPSSPGLAELYPDLITWQPDHWTELSAAIEFYIEHDDEREAIRLAAHHHTRTHHTYAHRMEEMLRVIAEEPYGRSTDRTDDPHVDEREVAAQTP